MSNCLRPLILPLVLTLLFQAHTVVSRADGGKGDIKLKTVVIDAGHGGKDPGALSRDRKHRESDINLDVAKALGRRIEKAYPDVKVIYTRTTDKFVELNERAAIANRNNADLFISIHVNAQEKGTTANGFSAHILGQRSKTNPNNKNDYFESNLNLTKRENSVILLEDDYSTKYAGYDPGNPASSILFNLLQNANYANSLSFAADICNQMKKGPICTNRSISQDIFLLLWKTSMPAVLVEIGFITNPSDLKVLSSQNGRDQIAARLFDAFRDFKKEYDGSLEAAPSAVPDAAEKPAQAEERTAPASNCVYGFQIFTLAKKLSASDKSFKGYDVTAYPSAGRYKYVVGSFATPEDARAGEAKVKKDFPDAFLVKVTDGCVERFRQ
ncbi:MAG: N-acetylmuramoyl-L-alanine amidase [Candidatus Cryptobacteroides sp.]